MKKTTKTAAKPKKAAPKKAAAKKAATSKKPAAPKKSAKPLGLTEYISAALDKDKALNIVAINLKGKTSIADAMVIATGTSSRHIASLARNLADKLKTEFKIACRIEGAEVGDWVVLDAGDVIVHLFREEIRTVYNLEKLWGSDFSTVNYTLYHAK